ncbi:Uncharacterised protein [Klebsiella pneumoniae subsp. rhinoscleromatis]|nr:Uncharacterised protein [Klebsiella pneumoniae subsp. rhinoscleromatis]
MASDTVPVVLPGGGCALPGLQDPLTGSHSVGPRKRSAAGEISGTVLLILPGGGYALPGLQDPLTGSHSVGPRKRSAARRDFRHGTLDFAGWRLRLTRPTGSHSVGPRKRSAAGRDFRHDTLDFAGRRLRLTRPTGSSHRLTLRRPAQAQRRQARFQARYS